MFNYYDSFNKNANLANKNIKRIFVATLNGNTGKIAINKCDNITRNAIAKELSDFLKNKLKIMGRIQKQRIVICNKSIFTHFWLCIGF